MLPVFTCVMERDFLWGQIETGQGAVAQGHRQKAGLDGMVKEIVPCEGGEAQITQRSCGCTIPGNVPGQAGQVPEQPHVVSGIPAHGRGVELDDL